MSTTTRRNAFLGNLRTFSPRHAVTICRWIRTPSDLQWLAPSETWPLTPQKVIGWKREGGRAFAYERAAGTPGPQLRGYGMSDDHEPAEFGNPDNPGLLGYGELNPMRGEADHYWLGHVIVDPQYRGLGIGADFVGRLIQYGVNGLGVRRISLMVFPANTAAVRCYRSAGFRRVGEEFHRCATSGLPERLIRMEYRAER